MNERATGDSSELTFLRKRVAELEAKAADLHREMEHLLNISQRLTKSGGWQWDVAKETMTWTEETYRIHDIDPREVAQGSPEHIALSQACYTPEDQPKITTAFQRCIELGEAYDLEFSFTTHKGRKLWIRTTAEAVWEDGRVARVRGNIQDITDRKRTEEHLKIYLNIISSAPDGIAFLDAQYRYVIVNDAYERFSGVSRDKFIGLTVAEYLGKEVFEKFIKPHFDTCLQDEIVSFQEWFDYPTLGRRFVEVTYFPYRNLLNQVAGVVANTRDITNRRRTAELLAARLRLSEASVSLGQNDVLTMALDEAEALTDSHIGFFHFLDDDQKAITLQGWSTATSGTFCQVEGLGLHYNLEAAGVWADCIRQRRAIVHNDYAGLSHRRGMPDGHAPVVRELVVPVFRNKRIVAILGVGNKSSEYNDKDTELLSNLGDLVWDIVLRKRAEESLKESEERFRTLASLAPVGIYLTSPEGQCQYANPRWCEMAGLTQAEALGTGWMAGLHPDDRDMVCGNWQQMVESAGHWGFEYRFRTPGGKTTWVYGLAAPQRDSTGKIIRYIGVNTDITEQKQATESIHKQADFTRRILNSTDDHLAILDEQGCILDVNNAWTRFEKENCHTGETIGIGTSYFCNWSQDYGDTSFAAEAFAGILQVQKGELDAFQIIYPCHSPTENRWFNMKVLPLSGALGHVVVAHSNITLLKQTEEKLTTTLQEKEVLLREVHHRVKNNMAAIIGLFNLQRQAMNDPQAQTVMAELSARVKAMSLVHEKLYRSESLARIDFQDYLQSLISHLRTSFGSPSIRCEINAFGVEMPLDLAVPCGMIINELIINALKYAFPQERSETLKKGDAIVVAMTRDNDIFSLSVADNGVGLPQGFDLKTVKSLGLVLVRMLGQHQLGGSYEVDQTDGTCFHLTFSMRNRRKGHE